MRTVGKYYCVLLTGEIFSESRGVKQKLDCIYHFPFDLEPNRIPFGVKAIGNNV